MKTMMSVACVFLFLWIATAQSTVKTLCTVPVNQDIPVACHAAFATKYYQHNFSTITWQYKYLTPDEGTVGPTAKNFVKTWALQSQHCDLLIGPGYSFLAAAMSPLVEIPWIDASATSTELSDKKNHPFYSRVIPTDEVGAAAAGLIYKKFGWDRSNILCTDEPYGRSVSAGFSNAIKGNGGQIDENRCFQSSAPEEVVRGAIEVFLQSNTKAVFVAGLPFHDWFPRFKKVVKETKASEKLIFFFGDAFCSTGDRTYVELVGGLCATYTYKEAVMTPFFNAMQTWERSDEFNSLRALGYGDASLSRCKSATDIYSVLAHDAALHGMTALANYEEELKNGKEASELGSRVEYLRKLITVSATGRITLEANGDRKVVDMVLYNSVDAITEKTVGFVANQVFNFHNPSSPDSVPEMTLLGETKAEIPAIAPPETLPPTFTQTEDNTGTIMAIVVTLVIALAVGSGAAIKIAGTKQRDNRTAPKDPEQPFTVVFTDIQSSTALWAREPQIMSDAVEMHHSAIRELIKKYRGYEVKTIGDSFMCAFREKNNAIEFSLDIQKTLFEMTWFKQELDVSYMDLLEEAGIMLPKNYKELWNGLRVRVGIHNGIGSIQEDPVTDGFDYYGTVVNTAARVESVGHGGQVLATVDMLKDLKLREDIQVVDLGCQKLRGLDEPVHLFQLADKSQPFWARSFPPLRLDRDFETDNETESAAHSDQRSQQSNTSQMSLNGLLHVKASKYAKNQGIVGQQASYLVEEIIQYQQFAKMLFSTTKDEFRYKTLSHLASKWRIPGVTEKSLKAGPREYESGVLDIVTKALQATKSKFAKETEVQILADGDSSSCSKSTTDQLRTRRNSALVETPLGVPELPGQAVEKIS